MISDLSLLLSRDYGGGVVHVPLVSLRIIRPRGRTELGKTQGMRK